MSNPTRPAFACMAVLVSGYKVWLNRLLTFERVEEIVFTVRYPSQPSQLTLYNFTLRDDVPADDTIDRKPADRPIRTVDSRELAGRRLPPVRLIGSPPQADRSARALARFRCGPCSGPLGFAASAH